MFYSILSFAVVSYLKNVVAHSADSSLCLPDGFVFLRDIDSTIREDIRYYSAHNFMGRRVEGYNTPACVLTREAAIALSAAQQIALGMNKSLKVYDCFRPQRAVDDFVAWSTNNFDLLMKDEFYPTMDKVDLFPDYIATKSGHSRGSTIDLTLIDLPEQEQEEYLSGQPLVSCFASVDDGRYGDNSLDFGTGFDCLCPYANTNSTFVTDVQHSRRELLVQLMAQHGFTNYAGEWWHYTLNMEPYPDTYFDFPIQTSCGCNNTT